MHLGANANDRIPLMGWPCLRADCTWKSREEPALRIEKQLCDSKSRFPSRHVSAGSSEQLGSLQGGSRLGRIIRAAGIAEGWITSAAFLVDDSVYIRLIQLGSQTLETGWDGPVIDHLHCHNKMRFISRDKWDINQWLAGSYWVLPGTIA